MPEIFRAFGLVFVIFPDDHDPPHTHVFCGGEKCKIFLKGPTVADKPRCTLPPARLRKALQLVAENQAILLQEWEKIHG
jgi:hypothetical protein